MGATSAVATTTVTPTEAGSPHPVVRDSSVDLSIGTGARSFFRTSSGSFGPVGGSAFFANTQTCRGDNPAGTNNSPRDVITVTGPGGDQVLSETSAVRDISLAAALTSPSYKPLNPQPAPGNTNYRGDLADSGAYHGMKATLDLTGKPAGVYTVTTTTTNMLRIGSGFFQIGGPCLVGTPTGTQTYAPGPVVETQTFEYRPWQVTFKDVFGKGRVDANLTPREHAFTVAGNRSAVRSGDTAQTFYAFDGAFLLPSDPAVCATDLSSCLPASAAACDPGAGCVPRLMAINSPTTETDPDGLVGVFDLDTRAFIASATAGGTTRVLASLGTDNDALYRATLQQLSDAAAAQGVDLPTLLASEVIVRNGQDQTSLSLLNGLQIEPSATHGGVHLSSAATVQAGVLLDIYSSLRLTGGACASNACSSSAANDRYRRNEDNGYTVTKTDLAPRVPSVGPLGAIVGGPVYHIRGDFTGAATPLVNTASAVIGVDTATDEPNGYPVWISPFVSSRPTSPLLARWTTSVRPPGRPARPRSATAGCLIVDFIVGTGVAVYNNPLPVGLGTLIDAVGEPSPEAAQLSGAVDTAIADVVGQVTSDPQVDVVLGTVLDALALPSIP